MKIIFFFLFKPIQKRQAEIEILHKDSLIDSSRVATIVSTSKRLFFEFEY
jgi:hypothetical protein